MNNASKNDVKVLVAGVGHAIPERVVTSLEVEERITAASPGFRMPRGIIQLMSGVRERRFADDGVTSSDLAAQAGRMALEHAGIEPEAIDLLIFAAASQDVTEPATANMVQVKTGCMNASNVDVKNACSSFVNAVDMAAAAIQSGRARRVLVTTGEVLHQAINWEVANTKELAHKFAAFTLGDAGGAMVLEASALDTDRGVYQADFVSDGRHWELSTVLAGGTLLGHIASEGAFFECRSEKLIGVALDNLPPLVRKVQDRMGWSGADIDLVVPHQVSRGAIEAMQTAFDFPAEHTQVTLDRFGNNAAASIPLGISLAAHEGRIQRGSKIIMIVGAAGFTAGVLPIVW